MNSNKKAKARREAQVKKTAQTKRILTTGVGIGMLFVGLWAGLTLQSAFAANTCGGSDEALEAYLEESQAREVTLLKTAQEGRVKAVLYEREDLGGCIALFQKHLFGLRWSYDGMNGFSDDGLHLTGSWNEGGFGGSKCEITVYGDNRGGEVNAYAVTDAGETVAREDLESDYILDIYILDGATELPRTLVQYDDTGAELE